MSAAPRPGHDHIDFAAATFGADQPLAASRAVSSNTQRRETCKDGGALESQFAPDSLLEGGGAEPSVPRCLAAAESVAAFIRRWMAAPRAAARARSVYRGRRLFGWYRRAEDG